MTGCVQWLENTGRNQNRGHKVNELFQIATDPNRTLDERWKAVQAMLENRRQIEPDVQQILFRTRARRRLRGA